MRTAILLLLLSVSWQMSGQHMVTQEGILGEWIVASYQIDVKSENPIWMEEIIKSKERFHFIFSEDGTIELKNTAIEAGNGIWELDGVHLLIEYDNAVAHIKWDGMVAQWQETLTFEIRHEDWKESFTLRRP
jgi:hypothetical protein